MSSKSGDILLNRLLKVVLCMLLIIFFVLLAHTLRGPQKTKRTNCTRHAGSDIEYDDGNDEDNENCRELPPPKKYFVYTSKCHMDYVNPFEMDAIDIFNLEKYRSCADRDDLVRVAYDNETQKYRLQLMGEARKPDTKIKCCYQQIKRIFWYASDDTYSLQHCMTIQHNSIVSKDVEAMIINCSLNDWTFQQLAYAFVHVKIDRRTGTDAKSNNSAATNDKTPLPSVLILGIDSLSRINFRRNMLATHKYLRNKLWFELEGYNKVAADGFGNQMALLTGNNEEEVYKKCNPKNIGGLNKCTFLWDQYKQRGYNTAYAEDLAKHSTFNYLKRGFQAAPTDHYLRPMIVAVDEHLAKTDRNPKNYCVGRRHYAEYVFDYAVNFVTAYPVEPIFGLFWASSFSRNAFDASASMDERFLWYLRTFEANGVMETSIVIFMSDHGMLDGPLRELPIGFLEERLPVFYISLPKWFQDAHPDFVAALEVNRNRLTSTYDIHATLQHVLELSTPKVKLPQPQGCAKCQSIFRAVPENRTCSDAGINEHWCTCELYRSVSVNNATVERIAIKIIERMNDYIEGSFPKSKCSALNMNSINKAEVKENLVQRNSMTYRIQFTAYPRNSIFQVTVPYNSQTRQIALNVQNINRLNKYERPFKCTNNKTIEHFCVCVYSFI